MANEPYSLLDAIMRSLGSGGSSSQQFPGGFSNPMVGQAEAAPAQPQPMMPSIPPSILGAINTGNTMGQIPTSQPEVPTSQETPQKEGTTDPQEKQHSQLGKVLMRIAPTLGAAILGSVNSDFLPGAAGFATGYETSLKDEADRKAKLEKENEPKKVFVLGDDGKPEEIGEIPNDAILRAKGMDADEFMERMNMVIGGGQPSAKTGDAVKGVQSELKGEDDRARRAREYLKSKEVDISDSTIKAFLDKNPNF